MQQETIEYEVSISAIKTVLDTRLYRRNGLLCVCSRIREKRFQT